MKSTKNKKLNLIKNVILFVINFLHGSPTAKIF